MHTPGVHNRHRIGSIILRRGSTDIDQLLRALNTPEVHVRVDRLSVLGEPTEPIEFPSATRLQLGREPVASSRDVTPTIVDVAIEITTGVARKLCRATAGECTLPRPRNLDVKAVLAIYIVANVGDLDNHPFPHHIRVCSTEVAPIARVCLAGESQLEALATILLSRETMTATYSCSRETHAEVARDHKRLIARTRSRGAPVATNRCNICVREHVASAGIARQHRLPQLALARP
mmetsp:Transcript_20696/g.51763  ORF Transcript_20696/g.51763 Transcript_20696/m.51763 type:complete len:234 (-) Transcript_20696:246-947(-)